MGIQLIKSSISGVYRVEGLYWENGKQNGDYFLGLMVKAQEFRVYEEICPLVLETAEWLNTRRPWQNVTT